MNNAFLKLDTESEEPKLSQSVALRERAEKVGEIIEALENIGGSSYWKVLKKYVLDVELVKAKRSLAREKDTTELFRAQGELRWEERLNIEKQLQKYRNELQSIKQQLHGK